MNEFYPKISIILPMNDNIDDVKLSIKSVLKQTYKNIELIVVGQNNSTMNKVKDKYDGKLVIYDIDDSCNNICLLNYGIEKMTGEYFSCLFPGDVYKENKIERQVSTLNLLDDKDTIIYSNYNLIDKSSKTSDRICFNHEEIQKNYKKILFSEYLNISTFLMPKKIFQKNAFFNHELEYGYYYYKFLELMKTYSFYHIEDFIVDVYHNVIVEHKDDLNVTNEFSIFYKKLINTFSSNKECSFDEFFYNCCNKKCLLFEQLYVFSDSKDNKNTKYNPLVSVIIPVYNGSNYIEEAIESVLSQTYSNYEVVVVNDGSTDNGLTEAAVKKFGNKIRYYLKKNGGVASALNFGIKKAKGEYISWLSHDDVYYSNKLEKQVEVLNMLENKETILFSNFDLINEKSVIFAKTKFDEKHDINQLENSIYPVLKGTTNGCAMLIPKSIFSDVGGFDETKKTTNDYEMWFKIFDKYPKKFIKDYLIKYRIHSQQDTKVSPVYVEESENMWSTVFKNIKISKIKQLKYEPLEFFGEFYLQMKESGLEKTASLLKDKFDKYYDENGPLVSVIMPCYNSEKYLSQAIDSLLNQSFMPFEILCVDDSSSDNTFQILLEYQKKDKRVRALKNVRSKGVSGAVNTGLDNARGSFITRMDSDDISYRDRLKVQYKFLKHNDNYGSCTVNIDFINKSGNVTGKGNYFLRNAPVEYQYLWTNPIPSAPCMYRKSILNGLRFNENFSTAEDYEFFMHISQHKMYCFEDVYYSYRVYDESLFHSNYIKTMNNSLLAAKKYYCEVTGKNVIPEFFALLTDFAIEPIYFENINFNDLYIYLNETLESFSKHFEWSDEEYNYAKDYTNFVLEKALSKYFNLKNETFDSSEYYKVVNSMSWKITKPLRFASKCVRKVKKDGVKDTIAKIVKKVIK